MKKDRELILNLNYCNLNINSQIKSFISLSEKSRRTFFRIRKELGLRERSKVFSYNFLENKDCYFCNKITNLKHHIDKNRKNNDENNIVYLCKSCHNKIHRLMSNFERELNKSACVSKKSNADTDTLYSDIEMKGGKK